MKERHGAATNVDIQIGTQKAMDNDRNDPENFTNVHILVMCT
jgi:hypothetical protein